MKKITVALMLAFLLAFGSIALAASLDDFKAVFSEEMTVAEVCDQLAKINGATPEDMSMLFLGLDGDATMMEVYKTLDNDAEIKDQFEQILQMVNVR